MKAPFIGGLQSPFVVPDDDDGDDKDDDDDCNDVCNGDITVLPAL